MRSAELMAHVLVANDSDSPLTLALRLATQLAIVLVYLVPSIIAQRCQHPKQPAILMLNVALGWTIVGWVIALIWALNANAAPRTLAHLPSGEHRAEHSGFRDSLLRGKIDALRKSVAAAERRKVNPQHVKRLKKVFAAAERELRDFRTRSK
jgi:hypothetical protein